MAKHASSRKDRLKDDFRAALLLARMTAVDFAALHGITSGHLSHVLSGKRDSRVLVEKIEAFTREQVRRAALRAA